MELVRKGTNRRRYVWVDFDAAGKTLGEVDFPWDGENLDFVAEKLHVYSNDPSIHNVAANDNSVTGVVEGTWHNYSAPDDNGDVPSDAKVNTYGWNDTLNTSGNGYGCFQVHRIFNEGEHWNSGEVLFAWNAWGIDKAKSTDEIGIGSFAACSSEFVSAFSMDYTGTSNSGNGAKDTLNAEAYSVRRVEIWASRHGVWVAGDGNFDDPDNWEDGQVPQAGDELDFSGVTSSITINCGDMGETVFAGVTLPTAKAQVVITNGTLRVASMTVVDDSRNFSVASGAKLVVDGDVTLNSDSSTTLYIVFENYGEVEIGGKVIITGLAKGYPCWKCSDAATISAKGIVSGSGSSGDHFKLNAFTSSTQTSKWIIGGDGLSNESGKKEFWLDYNISAGAELKAADDFAIDSKIGARTKLTLDTNDGKTITINGEIFREHGADNTLTVKGAGKVVCNYEQTESKKFDGNVVVTNTATLAIKAGKQVTTGKTTIASGAALELPDSATASVVFPGGLVFGDGEGHPVLSLGGLSANVTSLVVNATTLTYYKNKVAVRFATVPAPGTYTILSAPNKTDLKDTYAGYLMVEDAALAGRCTFEVSSDKHSVWLTVAGYADDDGNGGSFTVLDSTLAKLPAGVTDPATKPEGSALSYAQADALGLLSDSGEITNEFAVVSISFNEDNQPVFSVTGAPNAGYAVTYSLLATVDLASGIWTEVEGLSSATGSGLVDASEKADEKFYKVKAVIGNK